MLIEVLISVPLIRLSLKHCAARRPRKIGQYFNVFIAHFPARTCPSARKTIEQRVDLNKFLGPSSLAARTTDSAGCTCYEAASSLCAIVWQESMERVRRKGWTTCKICIWIWQLTNRYWGEGKLYLNNAPSTPPIQPASSAINIRCLCTLGVSHFLRNISHFHALASDVRIYVYMFGRVKLSVPLAWWCVFVILRVINHPSVLTTAATQPAMLGAKTFADRV